MEKRTSSRFDLVAPARIYLEGELQEILSAETRDISEKGAFLRVDRPLTQGAEVDLEVLLCIDKLLKVFEKTQTIKLCVTGEVVRTEQMGVAVKFRRKYKIEPTTVSAGAEG